MIPIIICILLLILVIFSFKNKNSSEDFRIVRYPLYPFYGYPVSYNDMPYVWYNRVTPYPFNNPTRYVNYPFFRYY